MAVSTEDKKQQLIYIGPTLKGFKLRKYQVFIGGYPTHIQNVYKVCPQIKRLFVEIKDLEQAKKEAAKAGTPMNKYYRLAQEV